MTSLKIKSLVALMAVAFAGQAAAEIKGTADGVVAGTTNTGGMELVFFAWDSVAKKSFTMDLGIQASAFLPGTANATTNHDWTVTGMSGWSDYLAATTVGNTKWGVVAFRQGDNFTNNETWLLSTLRAGANFNAQTSGNLKGINAAMSGFISDANSEGHAGAGDKSDFSASGDGNSYWGTQLGAKLQNKLTAFADNAVGTDSTFWLLSAQETGNTVNTKFALGAIDAKWGFKADTSGAYALTYTAPVPEPETYAMMLAGLGLLGGIARRRARA